MKVSTVIIHLLNKEFSADKWPCGCTGVGSVRESVPHGAQWRDALGTGLDPPIHGAHTRKVCPAATAQHGPQDKTE